jgi:hypothetical protein
MNRWLDKAWPRALAQRSALALALATLLSRSLTAAGGSPVSRRRRLSATRFIPACAARPRDRLAGIGCGAAVICPVFHEVIACKP